MTLCPSPGPLVVQSVRRRGTTTQLKCARGSFLSAVPRHHVGEPACPYPHENDRETPEGWCCL